MVLIADPNRYESNAGSGDNNTLLYNLVVSADYESPKKRNFKHGKKELTGWYEDVWFLARFEHIGIVSFHRKRDAKERVLCHKTFGSDRRCPACESYQNSSKRDSHWIKAKEEALIVPVLSIRRQTEPHIHKNKFQIIPIYWFEMTITSYREDYHANYLRLREANEKHPLHKFPYRIFAKKRGEKEIQEYYFKALEESDKTQISTDHPLIDDWMDDKGKWLWNADYQEMLAAMAIVRYKQYVDPATNEVFEYDGLYEEALEQFESFRESFPECKTELDEPVAEDDDDEELD